jgi:GTPase SAR1 family protein
VDGDNISSIILIHHPFPFPRLIRFQDYSTSVMVDGASLLLALHDTSGQEDFEALRRMSYSNADILLLCYSVDNRASLEDVRMKVCDHVYIDHLLL